MCKLCIESTNLHEIIELDICDQIKQLPKN